MKNACYVVEIYAVGAWCIYTLFGYLSAKGSIDKMACLNFPIGEKRDLPYDDREGVSASC
jgi:hypothetical protein